jgi:hypothetical protein
MTKNVLASIFAAARDLVRSPRSLAVLFALYLAFIAAIFFFITTREATLWQLFVTGASVLLVPLLFFVVQAAGATYAVGERSAAGLLRRTARGFLKVILVSVPVILLTVLSVYLLDKLEQRVQLTPQERASVEYARNTSDDEEAESSASSSSEESKPKPPVRWKYLLVSALRLLVLGLFLPLAAMHLWLAAVRDGLGSTFARFPRHFLRAFSARSVLTYGVGMIVFALIPYFLITKRTPLSSNTFELLVFGVRILVAVSLMLFGWVMTMTALARFDGQTAPMATTEPLLDQSPHAPTATATS